jgi:sulfate adenylyltransferase subunit 1
MWRTVIFLHQNENSLSLTHRVMCNTPGTWITGASNANLIIILIDARQGVSVEQTRRAFHYCFTAEHRHIIVAINKMDLVNYSHDVFNNIVIDYAEVVKSLGLTDVHYIPVSALQGDNIVDKSEKMTWYEGESLLHFLENVEIQQDINLTDASSRAICYSPAN